MEKKKHCILVVDDDVNVVEVLKINLSESGYDVITAYDGKDGLKKFAETKPDLIITDILMPGIDGYHFCWDIFFEDGLYVAPAPKIIILTGRDKKLDNGISDKIGVDAYITKPFDVPDLLKKIEKLIG